MNDMYETDTFVSTLNSKYCGYVNALHTILHWCVMEGNVGQAWINSHWHWNFSTCRASLDLLPQSPTCNTHPQPERDREGEQTPIGAGLLPLVRVNQNNGCWEGRAVSILPAACTFTRLNGTHREGESDARGWKGSGEKSHTRGQLILLAGGWFSFQAKLLRGGEKNQHISFFKGITYLKSAVYWNGPPLLSRSPTFWLSQAAAL